MTEDSLQVWNKRFDQLEDTLVDLMKDLNNEFQTHRQETHAEFRNLSEEINGEFQSMRTEINGEFQNLRQEMNGRFKSMWKKAEDISRDSNAHFRNQNKKLDDVLDLMADKENLVNQRQDS